MYNVLLFVEASNLVEFVTERMSHCWMVLKLPCPLGLRDYILGSEENIQWLLCN